MCVWILFFLYMERDRQIDRQRVGGREIMRGEKEGEREGERERDG